MIWYEEEVVRVEKELSHLSYKPETVFFGSSSFTLWSTLYDEFSDYKPINLGFGGSTLAACVWFFDRILAPVPSPDKIVIYAGDNDLGDGRHPEEVLLSYRQLIGLIRQQFGDIPCFFVSIKPSLQRWEILPRIVETNNLIRLETEKSGSDFYVDIFPAMLTSEGKPNPVLFESDGLHLSKQGYKLWAEIIKRALDLKKTN